MSNFDEIDPLDAAFANPKAGKKLKPGETLPGLEASSSSRRELSYDLEAAPAVPDAALSAALDDAFSRSRFDEVPQPVMEGPEDSDMVSAAEEKLARSLDDAFANPKSGEKIASTPSGSTGVTPEQLGLTGYKPQVDLYATPPSSSGFLSPKVLVIGMLLAVVIVGAMVGSADHEVVKPNVIRLTD